MSQEWTGSVRIEAPPEAVYAYLADFTRHVEWDAATMRVEAKKPGDAAGIGAEYRAYERLDSLTRIGDRESRLGRQAGPATREVRALVPSRRIAWHTHPIPKIGISADCVFSFEAEGDGTRLTQIVHFNTPGLVDAVEKLVLRSMDDKQRAQWQGNLDRIKEIVEQGAPVREPELALVGG